MDITIVLRGTDTSSMWHKRSLSSATNYTVALFCWTGTEDWSYIGQAFSDTILAQACLNLPFSKGATDILFGMGIEDWRHLLFFFSMGVGSWQKEERTLSSSWGFVDTMGCVRCGRTSGLTSAFWFPYSLTAISKLAHPWLETLAKYITNCKCLGPFQSQYKVQK